MGVPNFYRWICERYPCLNQVVKEHQVPECDNFYVDVNGIIHACSHPNDDPNFQRSEDKIFADICYYLDFLIKMTKPQKVFFMAVDGVAPRAKMNQQRGRRFRIAKAQYQHIVEQKATAGGEILGTEDLMDSTCITPGTTFMSRFHQVLEGFITLKISTDPLWQNLRVYLSGHDIPGEGEHKIMDFIRHEKSKDNYNANTRHCLYGHDVDFIFLALASHEIYFTLLRNTGNRTICLEKKSFHFMSISLLRDYLGHEFMPIQRKLTFEFNLERLIDDFVLMSMLVGNDYIPHLPNFHIHEDAFPKLFHCYNKVLPSLGGYLNDSGNLNLQRFEKLFEELAKIDYEAFRNTFCNEPKKRYEWIGLEFLFDFNSFKRDYYSKMECSTDKGKIQYYVNAYVQTIQWNLNYYYNGITSWSWFYPHHYAPYISDIRNFKDLMITFDLGEPFSQLQQQLAVLPVQSKRLLPLPYQDLMCNPNSPLKNYYPKEFKMDLNGKEKDWEAIVLIPFIDETLLRKCTFEVLDKLTAEEKRRDQYGHNLLYTYTKNSGGPCGSFLPGYFPPLKWNHAKCQIMCKDIFRVPLKSLRKGLCSGVTMDSYFLGFPTLKHIRHTARLSKEDVKVFQTVSNNENMMLTITEPVERDTKQVASYLLGKIIHVGWPHLHEGYVMSISSENDTYVWEKSKIIRTETNPELWIAQAKSVHEYHHKQLGIFIGELDNLILVHVKSLMGSRLICNADVKVVEDKQWTQTTNVYPLQACCVKDIAVHFNETKMAKTYKDIFPLGATVFMIDGHMGTIFSNDLTGNSGFIWLQVEEPHEPDIEKIIENQANLVSKNYWLPGYQLAKSFGTSSYFLSRITGTVLIQTNLKGSFNLSTINVGLNLKSNRKNQEVVGFTKKNERNEWLYSEQVLETLREYRSKFREFFLRLIHYVNQEVLYLEDMYPVSGGLETITKVSDWLKSQKCFSAERQTCGQNTLDVGIISAIDDLVSHSVLIPPHNFQMHVKPQELYNPFNCKGRYIFRPDTQYELFDRVMNVNHDLAVPLGMRGTVIGIKKAEEFCNYSLTVLFDKEFLGGLALYSNSNKAYRMSPSAMVNLTDYDRCFVIGNV